MNENAKQNALESAVTDEGIVCRRTSSRAQITAQVLAFTPEDLARQNQALGLTVEKFHVEKMRAQLFSYFRRPINRS